MNDIEKDRDLLEFIEEVFIKRNWDLFLSLVLEIDKNQLNELLNNGVIDQLSTKIDLYIQIQEDDIQFKSLLKDYGIEILSPNSAQNIINLNDNTNFEFIDDLLLNSLDFQKENGLIPTIVQDLNNTVLMLAYSKPESLKRTISTRRATYYSRSREKLWVKGEESGNFQEIKKIYYDCDADALLFMVDQKGVACHTGSYSCFQLPQFSIRYLYNIINQRIQEAKTTESYTKRLSEDSKLLLSKIKEESQEVINYTDRDNLIWEIADLAYFILVLMATENITPKQIVKELGRRNK